MTTKNFAVPFALTTQGMVATTSDPNVIASNRVNSLIGTYPGERVMQPGYGVDTNSYLFTPDIISETDLLATDIKSAASTWEPSITVSSVTPVVTQADVGISQVNVEFTISNDPTFKPAQTATVLVGGSVVDN
jgi:phage baseplate assembly protein W